jgi:hypothetical protein
MAFTGAFAISQGYDASTFTLTDTSVGDDPTLSGRQVRLIRTDGNGLLPAGNTLGYIDWPLADGTTLDLVNILPRDLALTVQVDWLTDTPGTSYEASAVYVFKGYGEQFDYALTQKMAANPSIIRDTYFFSNKSKFRTLLDNAANAVLVASDQASAQLNLDLSYSMILNESSLF